jgi:hypothetical protein
MEKNFLCLLLRHRNFNRNLQELMESGGLKHWNITRVE